MHRRPSFHQRRDASAIVRKDEVQAACGVQRVHPDASVDDERYELAGKYECRAGAWPRIPDLALVDATTADAATRACDRRRLARQRAPRSGPARAGAAGPDPRGHPVTGGEYGRRPHRCLQSGKKAFPAAVTC